MLAAKVVKAHSKGFTLIEVVVSLVLISIALAFMSSLFFSSPNRSVIPLLQVRAAEFGQSLMDEILSKPFDELTPVGGVPACAVCTAAASLGAEEASRSDYDDVDDYHSYCDVAAPYDNPLVDANGNQLPGFNGFGMSVCVVYDGNYDGNSDNTQTAKLITVDIYAPSGGVDRERIRFRAYRSNY